MAVAHHGIRRTRDGVHTAFKRIASGFLIDGELADRRAQPAHHIHFLAGVVIVAGDGNALLSRDVGELGQLVVRHLLAAQAPRNNAVELLLGKLAVVIAVHRLTIHQHVAVLPLAGRVVHERNQVEPSLLKVALDLVIAIDRIELHAKVHAVANQMVALFARLHGANGVEQLAHVFEMPDRLRFELIVPHDRKRVVDGGDAVPHQLPVAFVQRGRKIHHHAGSRARDVFDVVGMNVHHAGRHISTARVHHRQAGCHVDVEAGRARVVGAGEVQRSHGGGRIGCGRDCLNHAVAHYHVMVFEDAVGAHHVAAAYDH